MALSDKVRLHVTPFNANLYDAIIPKTLQSVATEVSYHQVQSDPDRGFGFVELPAADADRLRKKLHGLTLRGHKMSIEVARPEKKRALELDAATESSAEVHKRARKSKRKDGEIPGYELPEGRQVKRGWTETEKKSRSSDKKPKREVSKYSKDKELLFKTSVKSKSGTKDVKDDPDKKRKTPTGPNVVHEFERTKRQPTFLRSEEIEKTGGALTFVDGQGWVDENGTVVEAVRPRRGRGGELVAPAKSPAEHTARPIDSPVAEASKPDTTLEHDDDEDSDVLANEASSGAALEGDNGLQISLHHAKESASEEDSKDSSSEATSESEEESVSSESDEDGSSAAEDVEGEKRSMPSDIGRPPVRSLMQPPEPVTAPVKEVHPLEALYKRRKDAPLKPTPIDTSFSFFGGSDEVSEAGDVAEMPQTPFTTQDLRSRGNRSAAPTPDTAAIGKRFSFAFGDQTPEDVDDDEAPESNSPLAEKADDHGKAKAAQTDDAPEEESEFAKYFWANRGDNNRSWKKARREALKQNRQRENRRLSRRVV